MYSSFVYIYKQNYPVRKTKSISMDIWLIKNINWKWSFEFLAQQDTIIL